jgi:hypothetical protein
MEEPLSMREKSCQGKHIIEDRMGRDLEIIFVIKKNIIAEIRAINSIQLGRASLSTYPLIEAFIFHILFIIIYMISI